MCMNRVRDMGSNLYEGGHGSYDKFLLICTSTLEIIIEPKLVKLHIDVEGS